MLNAKMLFLIFRTRGVRDFVLWRDDPDQIIPGYLHAFLYASEKVFMIMYGLCDYTVIFLHKKYVDHGGIGTLDVKH